MSAGIEVRPTKFPEAKLFVPVVHRDARGSFRHTFSTSEYGPLGITDDFVEDSVSVSGANVVRGLHYDPRLAKFVQVLHGAAFDVIVDVRRESPRFGLWEGFELSADNCVQLYVPRGFAHGFCTLAPHVVFSYKQTAPYDPSTEGQVRWNDPEIGITWPLTGEPVLSVKDAAAPLLASLR